MSKARDIANAGTALSSVDATELGYLDGVTSAVQTQIDSKIGSASAINPTIVDAKGDLIAATAADTVSRLAIGANDTVLTADSTAATGLKWAVPGGALNITQIATGSINSGTSVVISSLTQDYLQLRLAGVTFATANATMQLLVNGSTSAVYEYAGGAAGAAFDELNATAATSFDLGGLQTFSSNGNALTITLTNCKSAGFTTISVTGYKVLSTRFIVNNAGIFKTAAQVTSLTITNSGGRAFNGTGTYTLYGA
jgi:hypothetical protein